MLNRYFDILSEKQIPWFQATRGQSTWLSAADLHDTELATLWLAHDDALAGLKADAGRSHAVRPAEKAIGPGAEASLLEAKVEIAHRLLSSCGFCERRCGADRAAGRAGTCGVPALSRYASEFFHLGEERELVPSHTIFFTGCNFECVYCQNWDIATRPEAGLPVDPGQLASLIDHGRARGSRNVNFVGGNPDPHLHTCLKIISLLQSDIPVVWNSNAYASTKTMKLLDGVVDVFLSDFRYGNDGCARAYSGVGRYWKTTTRNFLMASTQSEVMLRHLVLPGHVDCCTEPIIKWISENIPGVYFNLMFQYRPEHEARRYRELGRLLTGEEMARARRLLRKYSVAAA